MKGRQYGIIYGVIEQGNTLSFSGATRKEAFVNGSITSWLGLLLGKGGLN